jgi:hypothetical protein
MANKSTLTAVRSISPVASDHVPDPHPHADNDDWEDKDDIERAVVVGSDSRSHLGELLSSRTGRHAFQHPYRRMYILCTVDERPAETGQPWFGRERLLCSLRSYDDGRLVIRVRPLRHALTSPNPC